MDNFIINFHSGLAYLVLFGLLLVTLFGLIGLSTKKEMSLLEKIITKVTGGLVHLQALAGIILWVVSDKIQAYMENVGAVMKSAEQRRIFLEHPLTMLIAVVVFTIGAKKIKNAASDATAHKGMLLYGGITLFLVALMVPWDKLF